MNQWFGIGNAGKDAELRFTGNQKAVLGWSLGVSQGYYGDKKSTFWLDCSLWGGLAEKLAPIIKKGERMAVSGSLGTREHNGKTYLTLRVNEITLLSGKPSAKVDQDPNDEIPF